MAEILGQAMPEIEILGQVELFGKEPDDFEVLGDVELYTAAERLEDVKTAIREKAEDKIAELAAAGKFDEVPEPDIMMMGPGAPPIGPTLTPEMIRGQAEQQIKLLESEFVSPKTKMFTAGIEESPLGRTFAGLTGERELVKEKPTFEETFERKPTLGEKAVGFGGTALADLPLIIGAEAAAGTLIALPVDMAAKHLATRSLIHAARSGAAGGIFHATSNFAEQMLDPEAENFDYAELGEEFITGMALWGAIGALGPVLGAAKGFAMQKLGRRFGKFARLKARIENCDLNISKLVDEETIAEYGQPMVEITGPNNFRKVMSGNAAVSFVKSIEKNEVMRHADAKMWKVFHEAMDKAWSEVEAKYILNPKSLASIGTMHDKLIGTVPALAERAENKVFGPGQLRKLARGATELGVKKEDVPVWMHEQLGGLEPFKLLTGFVRPLMEGERLANRYSRRLLTYIHRNIKKPIREVSRETGKSELAIRENMYEWLTAASRREHTDPMLIVNQINRWRKQLPELAGTSEAKGMLPEHLMEARIAKFAEKRQLGKMAEKTLRDLVLGKRAGLEIGPEYVERTFKRVLQPRASLRGQKRSIYVKELETMGYTPKKAQSILKQFDKLTEEERGKFLAKFGVPIQRVEDIERIYEMSEKEIAIARKVRQLWDGMFNSAGLEPATYLNWYAPLRSAKDVVTMQEAYQLMKKLPEHTKLRMKFFAEMHRRGEVLVPEKDIVKLLTNYAWGSGRARYLNEVLNVTSQNFLEAKALKGTPLYDVMAKFHEDIRSGFRSRMDEALCIGLNQASQGKIPPIVFRELGETALSNVYGGTMGLRPWLLARNLTQPWLTTGVITGYKPLVQAYLDIGNRKLWTDFFKQGIHMQRGGGLPFGEDIMRKFAELEGLGTGWTAVRKVLAVMREANYLTTRPYQLSDTLNRFISYRAGVNMVTGGLSPKFVNRLAKKVLKEAAKIPTMPVRGKIKLSDIRKSRYLAVREIVKSKEMDQLMRATGIDRSFLPVTVLDYKERIANIMMGGEISGKTMKAAGGFFPYVEKNTKSVVDSIRELFTGDRGTLQKALKATVGSKYLEPVATEAAFRDSISRAVARRMVADTQWLYGKTMQAKWLQNRVFGMFQVWPSQYINFLINHLFRIGTAVDKLNKATKTAATYSALYAMLDYVGISPGYLLRSFQIPTGGPLFQAATDAAKLTSPGTPEFEKEVVKGRMLGTLPELISPGPTGEIRSLYQAYKGEKEPIKGILGAPMTKEQRSYYHRPKSIEWDTKKITANRVKYIRKLVSEMDEVKTTLYSEDPDVRSAAERLYTEKYYRLRNVLAPVTQYVPGDPVAVAKQVLDEYERKILPKK